MRGFMRALEKAGLVERDETDGLDTPVMTDSDVDALIAREQAGAPAADPVQPGIPAPSAEMLVDQADAIVPREFENIYAGAAIPASPYPAEKMLRLLDGLKSMDIASRKMAVQAMDSADDSWTVDDAILDAQRKIQILNGEKNRIAEQAQQIVVRNQDAAQARDEQQRSKVDALRAQIAELERMVSEEISSASTDKAAFMTTGENARQAALREATRLDAEIARLGSVPSLFGSKS